MGETMRLEHRRIGNFVRVPAAARRNRENPATTGGTAAPDERVEEFMKKIEALRGDAQLRALSGNVDPDGRARALGAYHVVLQLKAAFLELFQTALPLPVIAPEGAEESESNG